MGKRVGKKILTTKIGLSTMLINPFCKRSDGPLAGDVLKQLVAYNGILSSFTAESQDLMKILSHSVSVMIQNLSRAYLKTHFLVCKFFSR